MNCTPIVRQYGILKNDWGAFIPKGQVISGEFKKTVVEDLRENGLSYREAAKKYALPSHERIRQWERIYLEEGSEGLYIDRRSRTSKLSGSQKGRKLKLNRQVEKDLIAENQRLRAELDYLKNCLSFKKGTAREKAQVISKLRHKHKLSLLLDVSGLPRATYYYHTKQQTQADKYEEIKAEITVIYHEKKIAPDLLKWCFEAEKPNQKWVTDLTEFDLFGQKLYLSQILDLCSRDVVSYTISDRPVLLMVTEMLDKAFAKAPDNTNLILHSDQGWQYRHKRYQRMLCKKGIRQYESQRELSGQCSD